MKVSAVYARVERERQISRIDGRHERLNSWDDRTDKKPKMDKALRDMSNYNPSTNIHGDVKLSGSYVKLLWF